MTEEAFVHSQAVAADRSRMLLLAFRVSDLARLAWKHGRLHARTIERRTTATFARTGLEVLRDADRMIHDHGSEWYAIALETRGRLGRSATPADARKILTRVRLALERVTPVTIETGWTTYEAVEPLAELDTVFEKALQKGARERERYAFFSLIGHELRTPLTSIRGYLETVLEDRLDPATQRRFTEIALRETLRMNRLIENLFDISLLDLRGESSRMERCSFRAALAVAEFATSAIRSKKNVQMKVHSNEDPSLCIGEDTLAQVLINVIDNSAKHGRADGIIEISVERDLENLVHITVADDGPGIPPAHREGLFRFGERGSTTAAGSGIGLGLVRLFVERAGGEISLCDSPLGGVGLRISLPSAAVAS
jgi:signal transduction histidine kinase